MLELSWCTWVTPATIRRFVSRHWRRARRESESSSNNGAGNDDGFGGDDIGGTVDTAATDVAISLRMIDVSECASMGRLCANGNHPGVDNCRESEWNESIQNCVDLGDDGFDFRGVRISIAAQQRRSWSIKQDDTRTAVGEDR